VQEMDQPPERRRVRPSARSPAALCAVTIA
jgi:hypothetical protein